MAIAGIALGVFMATLDTSIVNISLPTLADYFDTDFATIQWVVLAYGLVITSLMLSVARIGDMLPKKRIYQTGLIIFIISSCLCGLAPSVGWLIAFRALQGLGGTMMQALGMAMVTEIFPASERGRALGTMGAVVSVGIAVGPPLGGLLIGLVGWQSVFWVNLPVGLITAFFVYRYVPDLRSARPGQRFDVAGAAILMAVLIAYASGMTRGQSIGFSSPLVLALLITAGLGLLVFLAVERKAAQPMVDLKLFRNPLFSINLLMGFLVFLVLAAGFIMPFLLQNVLGYSTQIVGLMMMSTPIAMGLVAPIAGTLSDRYGSRVISLIGLLVLVVGCLVMSTLNTSVTPLGIVARMAPFGIGFGLFQAPNNSSIMGSAPRERLGVASGLIGLSRTLGNSSGLPLMGSIYGAFVLAAGNLPVGTDVNTAPAQAVVVGIQGAYIVAAVGIFITTLLAVLALWVDARRKARQTSR
ncbi:MAG: MFS transporter [Anaerolineaceae bacterium]|nr:MFS transporter [Anaerolineaceae bacterium]